MLACQDKPAATATAPTPTVPAASTEAPDASAPTAAASEAGAPDGGGKHAKRRGHGGPGVMLFRAARGLDLKPEQKTKLDAIEKTAHEGASDASRDAMKSAAKGLHTELVAGIKAGAIDAKKLEPHYAAIEKLMTAAHAKEAEALNALHATLDPKQRKAAVATVRTQHAEREKKMAQRDAGADGGRGGKGRGAKHSLARLTRGLDLDAAQQKKVDALAAKGEGAGARPDPAEMKKRMEALLVAFEKDTFDAKKVLGSPAKQLRGRMAQETKLLGQLLPILKPAQREKLAAEMEKGPSPHGRRGGFEHRMAEGEEDDDDD